MAQDYIVVDNITFSYENSRQKVFENFSLNIEKGTFTAIIGHNGSGKSTLAKLLCGMLLSDSGTVSVSGITVADNDELFEIREKCAMIFQNPDNQLVASVVEEDVAFAPENLGMPPKKIREVVDNALEIVGMSDYALHATQKLSGGQKQRVAIAGVLAMMPECIIFDEATAMLDPDGRRVVLETMKKLNRENNITVITITHYMNEAVEADRVVVLNKGKVHMDGTPREVFSDIERLRDSSLAAPQITELLYMIEKDGYEMPRGVLHTMEAADVVQNIIKKKR